MKVPYSENIIEIKVLGSRFIGILCPLDSEEEVNPLLAKYRELYPKATHYCSASRFGPHETCSDDGEPARSAGMPLLTLLRDHQLDRAFLLVVRYFGGTKLGLPRLTRTYRETGEEAIKTAEYASIVEGKEVVLSLTYPEYETLKRLAAKGEAQLVDPDFAERVHLKLVGDATIVQSLLHALNGIEPLMERNIEIRKKEAV